MALAGLTQKVALVTGAASGIGEATVRRLSAEGASVVAVDIDFESAQALCESLPGPSLALRADVGVEADVQSALDMALERFGRVDLYHLNAGVAGSLAPFEELELDDFDYVLDVNLRGVFLGLRAAFRQYARQESGGNIVVTASIGSLRGSSDLIPYHVSKHGVVGLMRCAAVHGAERGVRVNAIAPGIVETGLFRSIAVDQPGGAGDWRMRARMAPLRRPGTVEEIADLVAFLLSGEAGFLTGELISIDGGATAVNPVRPSGQPPPASA